MKKLSILLAMFAFLFCTMTVKADEAYDSKRGNVQFATYVGSFSYSADSDFFQLKVPAEYISWTMQVVSSGVRIKLLGQATCTNGTALTSWNVRSDKGNLLGVNTYITPRTPALSGTTNAWFYLPTGIQDFPVTVYTRNMTATNFLIRVENSYTTNCSYSVRFKFQKWDLK